MTSTQTELVIFELTYFFIVRRLYQSTCRVFFLDKFRKFYSLNLGYHIGSGFYELEE